MTDRICLESTDGHAIGHIETVAEHPMFYAPRLTAHEMRVLIESVRRSYPVVSNKLTALLTHLDSEE